MQKYHDKYLYIYGYKMTQTSNPLRQFFRQPAIFIKLPSGGQHWAPNTLEMPESGELAVYPMTAIDEITYRTPDALYNGEAVVSVIQSCIPSIKDAWATPGIDLDTILIAIRIASYGHEMEIDTVCPSCTETNEIGMDLRKIMERLRAGDFSKPITHGELEIHLKPLNYRQITKNSVKQFEEQKVINVIPDSTLTEEEKIQHLNKAIKNLTELTIHTMANCISMVRAQGILVTEPEYILEWLQNCDSVLFAKIREHIASLREQTDMKPIELSCPACQHKYLQPVSLDQSNFFGDAS